MVLIGNATLSFVDAGGAVIKSGGTLPGFMMHLNIVAWVKMVKLVVREAVIQANGVDIDMMVEIFQETNQYLAEYFEQLKQIDLEKYEKEVSQYTAWNEQFETVQKEEDLNSLLLTIYNENDIIKPWQGDFDEFMSDSNNQLVFE